jgi:hypothetical protein
MGHGKFATAVNCMDGRTQEPVRQLLIKEFGVDYVDAVTEPGPLKYLSEGADTAVLAHLKEQLDISWNKHNSRVIAVVGHAECAGNTVDKDTQLSQMGAAIEAIKNWGFDGEVFGIWVEPVNGVWTAVRV